MKKEKFGTTKDGKEVTRYTLENANGMKVSMVWSISWTRMIRPIVFTVDIFVLII